MDRVYKPDVGMTPGTALTIRDEGINERCDERSRGDARNPTRHEG
jgi:hypothetical protein